MYISKMIQDKYVVDIPDDSDPDFVLGIANTARFVHGVYQLQRRLSDDIHLTANYLRLLNLHEIARRGWVNVNHRGKDITSLYPFTCSYVYTCDRLPSDTYMRIDPNIDLYMTPCAKNTDEFIRGVTMFLELLSHQLPILSLPNIYIDTKIVEPVIIKFPIFDLADDIISKIVRYCPHTCIRVNRYFHSVSLRYLLPTNPTDLINMFIQANMNDALSGVLRAKPVTTKDVFLTALNHNNRIVAMYCLNRTSNKTDYLIHARYTTNIELYELLIQKLSSDTKLDGLVRRCYRDDLLPIFIILMRNQFISNKLILELAIDACRSCRNNDNKLEWIRAMIVHLNCDAHKDLIYDLLCTNMIDLTDEVVEILVANVRFTEEQLSILVTTAITLERNDITSVLTSISTLHV